MKGLKKFYVIFFFIIQNNSKTNFPKIPTNQMWNNSFMTKKKNKPVFNSTSTTQRKQFFYNWEKIETQSTSEIPSGRTFHTTVLDEESIFIYGGKEGK
jgi:hypothetical protein